MSCGGGIMPRQLNGRHAQSVERRELGGERGIFGNAVGMKLEIDPFLEAHLLDLVKIAGTRAESQTVEGVDDFADRSKAGWRIGQPRASERDSREREERASPHKTILLNAGRSGKLRGGRKY